MAAAVSGCAVSGLNLVNDHRLRFESPPSRAHVHLPLSLSWTIRDFTPVQRGSEPPSHDRGYFGIFVDRAPVGPGETLESIAHDDTACKRTPGCPDASYLTNRQIYTTTRTRLVLDHVDNLIGSHEHQQLHEVTVILVDSSGNRIGEGAWHVDFWLRQAGST